MHALPPDSWGIPHSVPDRRFVHALFDGLAPRYDRALLGYTLGQDLRWKHVLLTRLAPRRGERALDLACGTGLLVERLARRVGAENVVGADINRTMLHASRQGRFRSKVVQSTAERLSLRAHSFDIVTAGYLLKYVDLDRFAAELARVLRPGGRFGAYDFSRPIRSTAAGRLYSLFLHRILPVWGRGARRAGRSGSWRTVFDFLPLVAESSRWEERVQESLGRAGFHDVRVVPSMGGAITWVWARRGGVTGADPSTAGQPA